MIRSLWRKWIRWRFRILHQRGQSGPVIERIRGRPIIVLPDVFNPNAFFTGAFFAGCLDQSLIPPGCRVLDMGTGTGVGAVIAAEWADRVVAVDINPAAVRCARLNALLNEVEGRVEVLQGDLFEPVEKRRFDVILFNPPYLPGEPQTPFEAALWSTDTLERFLGGLAAHLKPAGYALLLISSVGDATALQRAVRSGRTQAENVAARSLPGETLTLLKIRPAIAGPP